MLALVGLAAQLRAETFVLLDGSPDDAAGRVSPQRLDTRDGAFAATVNVAGGVSITFHGESSFGFEAAAPGGRRLVTGSYESAAPLPLQPADRPGLSATSDARGCTALGGRFVVLEAGYDRSGQIERFAADFVQRCDAGGPPLVGSVRFNSDVPVRDYDGDGAIDIRDNCPAIPNIDQSDVDADGIGSICDPVQGVTAIVLDGPSTDGASRPPARSFGPRTGIRAFLNPAGGVSLRVADAALDFSPPRGRTFDVGRFDSGLEVTARRLGCSARGGRFEVLELKLAPSGEVLNLAIDFLQRCEGNRSVSGIVRFNSERVGAPELDVDADGVINLADSCPMDRNADQANRDGDELGDACDPYPDQRDNLSACQAEGDGARALRAAHDETLAVLLGQSTELHHQNQALREENERLRAALSDADGDGVVNELDHCAGSPGSVAVDRSGCTRAQFCERIPLVSFAAGLRCFSAAFADEGAFQSCSVDLGDAARGARCTAR